MLIVLSMVTGTGNILIINKYLVNYSQWRSWLFSNRYHVPLMCGAGLYTVERGSSDYFGQDSFFLSVKIKNVTVQMDTQKTV